MIAVVDCCLLSPFSSHEHFSLGCKFTIAIYLCTLSIHVRYFNSNSASNILSCCPSCCLLCLRLLYSSRFERFIVYPHGQRTFSPHTHPHILLLFGFALRFALPAIDHIFSPPLPSYFLSSFTMCTHCT